MSEILNEEIIKNICPAVVNFRDSFREIAEQYMGSDGSHDVQHLDRVWHNAVMIISNDNLDVDYTVVCAACYLHDIKQFRKDDINNSKSSSLASEFADDILKEHFRSITDVQRNIIKQCILAHSYSASIKPETLEAKVVQDADRLDSLGAIGIARLFYTAGILGTKLYCDKPHMINDKLMPLIIFIKNYLNYLIC